MRLRGREVGKVGAKAIDRGFDFFDLGGA